MDIQMPNMNGFVAARAIRKVAKPDAQIIPIIALSADDTLEDVRKCKEAGMNAHIAKPVEPQNYIRFCVSTCLRRFKRQFYNRKIQWAL